jgi:hypothetical protein
MSACFFASSGDSGDLVPVASSGTAAAMLQDLRIPIGERISGWALAHRQTVQNSNAALELGPVARTLAVPLRYVVSVPVLNGHSAPFGVVSFFGSDPFSNDHLRMLESAVTLFSAALAVLPARQTDRAQNARESAGSGPRIH